MKLNIEQTEMLYEIAEIHFDWIHKYNPDSKTTFKEMLEINHGKLLNCFFDVDYYTGDDVMDRLFKMRAHVLRLTDEY